jgi:hypothetical protein
MDFKSEIYFPFFPLFVNDFHNIPIIAKHFQNFPLLILEDQIIDMKRGPKPLQRTLMPQILQILEEVNCDLRAWTITVRLRQLIGKPNLKWETVHKYLEQMVKEQMIFRYEDASGIVTYSKNQIVREKVLF